MKALPDSIAKRDILHGAKAVDAATFLSHAKRYLAADQLSDAIDFFWKAGAEDELQALSKTLVQDGDTFLLLKIMHFKHGLIPTSDLESCASNAEKAGKIRYAIMAHQKLENDDKVGALKESISTDGDMIAEREAETFLAANLEEIQEVDEDDDEE